MLRIIQEINLLLKEKESIIVAIDGRCASGKTTLSKKLKEIFDCNIIHMDDFFLRREQRTIERLNEPGGNVDRERVLKEVLIPLSKEKIFSYRPYDCKSMSFGKEINVEKNKITIIEGSYSCHPDLFSFYDLHIFCDTEKNIQSQRLMKRNGNNIDDFIEKWIPMEEKYFSYYNIEEKCEITVKGEF